MFGFSFSSLHETLKVKICVNAWYLLVFKKVIQNFFFVLLWFRLQPFIKYCQSSDCRLGVQAKFKLAETRHNNQSSFEIVSTE